MSATLPCLKQFLAIFDSGLIGGLGDSINNTRNGTAGSQSFVLASVARQPATPRVSRIAVASGMRLRPDKGFDVTVDITTDKRNSVDSDGSARAIIKKTQKWEVSYE